ncbi:Hypothetical predicted protein [Mytilus galloprovincialis]|uniref:Peptidase M12B domain-containing protein n=1 Tax=Mytilus galloprovincialis TaxID=29158 RepID=A0A8B6GH71_MYTGA|nr:Hypothetical predicted protein [Mytilus galloprovincialis]
MRSGSFDTSGTAYLNSICTTRSNSIVEEKFDFIAATVAAHEIGHALGAVHDGENNRCSASSGFIMVSISQALRPPNQKSPWQFSSCTSREIGLYLDELNKKGSHCMQRTHPNAKNFNPGSQKKLGQTFDVDKQCEFIIGKGSYACRSFIGNSENVCTGLWCKTLDMTSTRCILGLPAEGTTCGSNKWCIGSSCVFDSRAPSRRRADCVFGDSPGSVLRGKTCSNLLRSEPFQCYSDSIKKNCCVSCEKVKTGIPTCITKYLLRNPVKFEIEEPLKSEHESAFAEFVSTIQEDLLVYKKVFYMNGLLELFTPFLPQNLRESYTTYRLQQKLEKHFGNTIVIQCQQGQGMSNIVYSSSISLSEAISTANRLKADMKPLRTHDLCTVSTPDCDEDLILHKAAGILRKHIGDVVIQSDAYPSPADTSLSQSQKIMPTILKTFICWLIDGDSYETVNKTMP